MKMSDNNNLLEQLTQIQWLLIRHHHNHFHHHDHGDFGLTGNPYRGQGRVLKLLKMQTEITQKDLLELLDMRPQSLGDLLRKLELKGYITRVPAENDRRAMIVRLTEKGINEEISDEEGLGFNSLFQCLTEEEQVQLGGYLKRIIDDWRGKDEREFAHGFHRFSDHHK